MTFDTVTSFVDAIRRLPLLEPPQLDELTNDLAARFPEPTSLAQELLQRNWLTPFQLHQILQGDGDQLVIADYILLERLGASDQGRVFKANDRKLSRYVALKLIHG